MTITLNELIEQGKAHADRILIKERGKELLPFFHLISPDRKGDMVIATPWANDIQKKIAIAQVKSMAHEINAQAALFVTEAWMRKLPKPLSAWHARRQMENFTPPSQSPDRIEVVMVVAAAADGEMACASLQMIRDKPGGKIIALVEDKEMPGTYESWMFTDMFRKGDEQ